MRSTEIVAPVRRVEEKEDNPAMTCACILVHGITIIDRQASVRVKRSETVKPHVSGKSVSGGIDRCVVGRDLQ